MPEPQTRDKVIIDIIARLERLEDVSGVRSTSTASGGSITEESFKPDFWTDNLKFLAGIFDPSRLNIMGFHIVEDLTLTDNTPSGGYVTWSAFKVYYDGSEYGVVTGNSNKKYLWWDKTAPYQMSASDTRPTLLDEDCIIAMNLSGIGYKTVMETYMEGGTFRAGSITAADAVFGTACIQTADIANLAVTTALIDNLAVTTAKIDDLAVTTAKIGAAQITSAKIDDAQIQTVHIGSGQVTIPKISTYTRWQVYTNQRNVVHTFGGDKYSLKSGDYAFNKNELLLELTTGSTSMVYGYLIMERAFSPEFKARAKISGTLALDTNMLLGLGTASQPWAFNLNQPLVLSTRNWTVNTKTEDQLGLHHATYAEGTWMENYTVSYAVKCTINKIAPDGTRTALANATYTVTQSSKTMVNWNINFSSQKTLAEGYALEVELRGILDGAPSAFPIYLISSPVKELVIPSGNSITIYLYVKRTGGVGQFWWGYSNISIVNNSRIILNFTHAGFYITPGATAVAYYLCRDLGVEESFVVKGRYNNDDGKSYWSFDEAGENWLFSDDVIDPPVNMQDGVFQISANAQGSDKLYVYNFIAQEEWL